MTKRQPFNHHQIGHDLLRITLRGPEKQPVISFVTVNYHADALIDQLARSIAQTSSIPWELLMCDNTITNRGYGAGCNLAAAHARGAYICIINPDTQFVSGAIQTLLKIANELQNRAVIAPQLIDTQKRAYLSTTNTLGWAQLAVAHSILNTLWPKNAVSSEFWYGHFSLSKSRLVENASGAALLFPRSIWKLIGGFDEHFFLYFEDNDLCCRLRQQHIPIWYEAGAQLVHPGGAATPNRAQAQKYFKQSRWRYSRRYFGVLPAIAVEGWLRVSDLVVSLFQRLVAPNRKIRNTK